MKWLSGMTNSMGMNLRELCEMVKDEEIWCDAVLDVAKSQI